MKILMLAPEPFFQPRGTPISVYFRTTALTALGHEVDLVTYPLGEDVEIENLRIFRLPNFLRLKKIKIGPSPGQGPARRGPDPQGAGPAPPRTATTSSSPTRKPPFPGSS